MEAELQTLIARLAAHRVLPRSDALVMRALTDDLFFTALTERLTACGLEWVEHPYAEHVCLRIRRELEVEVRELERHVPGVVRVWLRETDEGEQALIRKLAEYPRLIEQAAAAGADTFVAGSAVFGADDPDRAIQSLRASAARHRH